MKKYLFIVLLSSYLPFIVNNLNFNALPIKFPNQLTSNQEQSAQQWLDERTFGDGFLSDDGKILTGTFQHLTGSANFNNPKFKNLTTLNLSTNKISSVSGFENIPNLDRINFSENQLSYFDTSNLTNL
jgi:Leucine-rich repeat (LRR) protein